MSIRILSFILLSLAFCADSFTQPVLTADAKADRVTITIDGQVFTEYQFADDQKYPYFFPVNGPASGKSLTTETSEPYPHHHSLFFGCDRVNGGNYWQEGLERGRIVSESISMGKVKGTEVSFTQLCIWLRPGAPSPFRDSRTITITAPSATLRIIDFEITLRALMDVTIEQTNHSLFAARMTGERSVKEGGVLINSRGQRGEAETAGKPAEWMDYGATLDGVFEGLAILEHPNNRWFPSPWFTRDYGFFSPTPFHWMKEGSLKFATGEELTLRYQVLVHQGTHEEADIAGWFKKYSEMK